jgi:uncharacterized protein with GYD domain
MPTYIALSKWTDQGVRNIKDLFSRYGQNRELADKLGIRIIAAWWTQGAYDGVVIAEAPDDETASAAVLALGIQGNVRSETLRAFTAEDMQRILQKLP